MSNDFQQWRRDRELIHFEREEHDRNRRRRPYRALWWVLLSVIVLPILLHSCGQAFGAKGNTRRSHSEATTVRRDSFS
jgi:hypothetical protein